jgi:hypothetical protein
MGRVKIKACFFVMFYGFMLGYEEEELIPFPPSLLPGKGHWNMLHHLIIHG